MSPLEEGGENESSDYAARTASSSSLSVISITQSGDFNKWRGQKPGLLSEVCIERLTLYQLR